MAKENGHSKEKAPAVYFKSLTIENVKCFKGKHTIDLSDGNLKPAQWTVILGNNNTGKTTVLKCLAGLEPTQYWMTIGPVGSTLEEMESGKTDSLKISFAAAIVVAKNLGDSFPSLLEDLFGIHAELLLRTQPTDSLPKTGFTQYSDANGGKDWGLRLGPEDRFSDTLLGPVTLIESLVIRSYGVSRKMNTNPISQEDHQSQPHLSLFGHADLPNMEDWLLNLFLAEKLGHPEARPVLELAKKILSSGLLPDVEEVKLSSREKGSGFVNFAEFRTDFGWIRLRDLGYGYQTMIAWVLDLVKRMVERYPGSPNPLTEPAIVLVDEIDLHLHPDWQRKIISHLTKYFPNTQFIVTAHSPLIVQSAEEVNLVILKKEGEVVYIEQPKIRSFRGWTVEEIMTDLMQLEGQTMSNTYLNLMQQFDEALDEDDYEKAKNAYEQLDKILHPESSQRKLMKIQMTSLSPVEAV